MMAAMGIAIEISLGFLGLDVAPPAPSWGSVLEDGSPLSHDRPVVGRPARRGDRAYDRLVRDSR